MRRLLLILLLGAIPAHAVIVRGKVTSPLGVPLPGARVQLIQGQRSVSAAFAGPDGAYNLESTLGGRFLLLTSPATFSRGFAPQVGEPFYAGSSDVLTVDIALSHTQITSQISSVSTFLPTPTAQFATDLSQVEADELLTSTTFFPEFRHLSSVDIVQKGALGTPASLYERGAPPATLLATANDVTANPLGGAFNLSTISTSGWAMLSARPAIELSPGANPLHAIGASGGTLDFHSATAETLHPTLLYTGDAGSRGALHQDVIATLAHNRFDILGGFSRFDIANAPPGQPFHLVTYSGNAGYHISAGTALRTTFRDDLSASGLANPYELFALVPSGRDANQAILGSVTFETRTLSNWHNQLRYGFARLRNQVFDYSTPAHGLPLTITGANGYTASGTASFIPLPSREDAVTNRDEATYQTDFRWKPWLNLLAQAQYRDVRAADILPAQKQTLERTHLSFAGGLQGDIRHRVFYQAAGSFDHSSFYGNTGNPRLGLTYAAIRQGTRKFRGTTLHATGAAGTRETSLLEEVAAPTSHLQPRSRTFEASLDQSILPQKLTVRASYFHSQFSHEFEPIGVSLLTTHDTLSQTLALRTQGIELDLRLQPYQRILLEGGYTYLAALTERSAAAPVFNPTAPILPIGGLTALTGQRPFNRPPNSGFLVAEYSGEKLDISLKGALVSGSDSSTYLIQSPSLLLPNRNLSPGYASLDANISYVLTPHVTFISQLTNLTDDRHLAPFGYLSTPFVARAGLRIRLGHE